MSDWARRLNCSAVGGGRAKGGLGGGVTSVGGVEVVEGGEHIMEGVEIRRCVGEDCRCCETPDVPCSVRVLSRLCDGRAENEPIRPRSQVTQSSWVGCLVFGVRNCGRLQDGQELSVRTWGIRASQFVGHDRSKVASDSAPILLAYTRPMYWAHP